MHATLMPLAFWAGTHSVHRLNRTNEPAIQALLERCPDHWKVHEGRKAPPDAAAAIFTDALPNYDPERIEILGIYDPIGRLVGIITSPPDYPDVGDWYVGLMLLEPSVRNRGMGESLYRAFEAWVTSQGGTRILLTVVDDNPRGRRFWNRMGFQEIRNVAPRLHGAKVQGMVEMERRLDGPTQLT